MLEDAMTAENGKS